MLGRKERTSWSKPVGPSRQVVKEAYEHEGAERRNLSVAGEPKAGHREVEVTCRRTKPDLPAFVQNLAQEVSAPARKLHFVLDNLNTHFRAAFEEVIGWEPAARVQSRVELHYTPKRASWLNLAQIEADIWDRQCLGCRTRD